MDKYVKPKFGENEELRADISIDRNSGALFIQPSRTGAYHIVETKYGKGTVSFTSQLDYYINKFRNFSRIALICDFVTDVGLIYKLGEIKYR